MRGDKSPCPVKPAESDSVAVSTAEIVSLMELGHLRSAIRAARSAGTAVEAR
jgi:hypothetical protein